MRRNYKIVKMTREQMTKHACDLCEFADGALCLLSRECPANDNEYLKKK